MMMVMVVVVMVMEMAMVGKGPMNLRSPATLGAKPGNLIRNA